MNLLYTFLLDATSAAEGAGGQEQPSIWQSLTPLLLMVGAFAFLYFFMMRPNRKRQKEEQKMRNDLRIGDQITTIGGISGRVLKVSEDDLTLETGADRNRITVKKWAVQTNETVHDTPVDDDDDDDDDI